MVDGAEHLTSCHLLAFLSAFSYIQLMQNSSPSTIYWCQCDIQMMLNMDDPLALIEWYITVAQRFL